METNMKQDLFTNLLSELITEILLRVPAHAIPICKCVCKSWHDLVSTHEFAKLHFSKSVPGVALIVKQKQKSTDKIIIEHTATVVEHHSSTITKLNITHPASAWINGSVDGLLLLTTNHVMSSCYQRKLHLCNPITRENIDLFHPHSQQPFEFLDSSYGFGVSKISGQYKAVGITKHPVHPIHECKLYTIGTGLWRSAVAPHAQITYSVGGSGKFVNGSLHWLAINSNGTLCTSCFDLETELFSIFYLPSSLEHKTHDYQDCTVLLFAQEGRLCLCDYTSFRVTMDIWMFVEGYWTRKFVIGTTPADLRWRHTPLKISQDGFIFLSLRAFNSLFYYSTKNKTVQKICNTDRCIYYADSYTPSFLSLKRFRMENSISF